ncbi:osmoprotectant ABC transporter substrate-binding protein [Brevibacillus massiliensis]|uniref:osmoprotectant ABC transporter substrate-binding protein n=1 Tax=Brevibacillus massiliensis TaxID=1118054 RepID=UPI0002FF5BD9|nr:osmoprotectant ABC transporter substrate-binding protein [Brevibacillus massiliensis]
MKRIGSFIIAGLLLFSVITGCSQSGASGSGDVVKIGSWSTSEHLILAHMIKLLIEQDTKLKPEIVEGLTSTPVVLKAMENNEIQISAVRYVGTDLSSSLKIENPPRDPDEALKMVQEGMQEKYDQKFFPSYGFENTYVFTVRQDLADKLNLQKVSDVAPYAKDLHLGTDNAWLERPNDGYPAFKKAYGIEFGKTSPMEIGLVYKAVSNKDVDIVLAYSTDSRLKEYQLKTLEDDKKFFPPYQAAPVARNDLLKKHPELEDVISKLVGQIDTETMTVLNYQADIKKVQPAEIAKNFLKEKGLLK